MSYQQVPEPEINSTPKVNPISGVSSTPGVNPTPQFKDEPPRRRRPLWLILLLLLLLLALLFGAFSFFTNLSKGGQTGTALSGAQTATAAAQSQGGATSSASLTATAAANSQGTKNASATAATGVQGGATLQVPAFNNVGARDDANTVQANFDGSGDSYSTEALRAAKIVPGQAFAVNGVNFKWPDALAGKENNYQANGQVIPVSPVSGATVVAFLGASSDGPSTGKGTITYTDGTKQTFDLSFTDWTARAGKNNVSFGNHVAATMPYRNKAGQKEMVNTYLFSSEITLTTGKTIRTVTLPSGTDKGQLHIFAVGTR